MNKHLKPIKMKKIIRILIYSSILLFGIMLSSNLLAKRADVQRPDDGKIKCYCTELNHCRPPGTGVYCDFYMAGGYDNCADKDPMCVPPPEG